MLDYTPQCAAKAFVRDLAKCVNFFLSDRDPSDIDIRAFSAFCLVPTSSIGTPHRTLWCAEGCGPTSKLVGRSAPCTHTAPDPSPESINVHLSFCTTCGFFVNLSVPGSAEPLKAVANSRYLAIDAALAASKAFRVLVLFLETATLAFDSFLQ